MTSTTHLAPPAGRPDARRNAASRWQGVRRSRSLRMVGWRLLLAVPVIWGATFLTFVLMNLLPGTAATALLGDNATPEAVAALNHQLGLDRPFAVRYLDWLGHALTGDFGTSLATHQSVVDIVAQRLGPSIELILFAFVLAVVLAVVVATVAARRPGGVFDRLSVLISTMALSAPSFVSALVLVFVFAVTLKAVPTLGFVSFPANPGKNLQMMILPSFSLALGLFATLNRMLRADLIDQLQSQDYVTTARAKGAKPWPILLRHVLRNSLFGLVTVAGLQLGTLIGTTLVVEKIFAIPGVGQQLMSAIQNQDIPVVEGLVCLIAVVTVLANLVTDLLYAVLDPRVRHDSASS
jgi:peptide/nickel transport system permease protein